MKNVIIYLDALAPLIPLFYLIKLRKEGALKGLLPLFLFFFLQCFFNSLENGLQYSDFSNYFLYHISLPLSFISLLFFLNSMGNKIFYSKTQFITGFTLVLFFILNSLLFEKIDTFNSISYSLSCLYMLIVCLKYYWFKGELDETGDILTDFYFWIISGFFIYYCSSFIVFPSYYFFIKSNDQNAGIVWRFHNVMFLIMSILITKGIKLKYQCQAKSYFQQSLE